MIDITLIVQVILLPFIAFVYRLRKEYVSFRYNLVDTIAKYCQHPSDNNENVPLLNAEIGLILCQYGCYDEKIVNQILDRYNAYDHQINRRGSTHDIRTTPNLKSIQNSIPSFREYCLMLLSTLEDEN